VSLDIVLLEKGLLENYILLIVQITSISRHYRSETMHLPVPLSASRTIRLNRTLHLDNVSLMIVEVTSNTRVTTSKDDDCR
jgi:hypothetical protein